MKVLTLNNFAALLFMSGLLCIALFKILKGTLDAEGILHEPFFLLPIGFSLIAISVISHLINKKSRA